MRIGPVMNIKACYHDDRYSNEVLVQSLFQDRTASSVTIVNGVDKYVTESMLTKGRRGNSFGETHCLSKTTTEATVTLTSVSIPVLERKWIDIETRSKVF